MSKKLHHWTVNLGLFGASCFLAVMGAELMVRKVSPHETSVPWEDNLNGVICPRPNAHGRYAIPNAFDVRLAINSQRFRADKDFTPEPGPGVLRIAALGDSFTHGVGANNDDNYPARLQTALAARLKSLGPGTVEVLNGGASSTGTADQALFFQQWVARFKPQVVLLNVFVNDVDEDLARNLFVLGSGGEASPRPFEALRAADHRIHAVHGIVNSVPAYSFLSQHLQLMGFLRTNGTIALNHFRFQAFATPAPAAPTEDPLAAFHKYGLRLMTAEIRWLNQQVTATGARLVIVYIPPREFIDPKQFPDDPGLFHVKSPEIAAALQEEARNHSLPFIDLTAPTIECAAATHKPLYYTGDFHATPTGYNCFAQAVAKFLAKRSMAADVWPPRRLASEHLSPAVVSQR
jgi:lysophospholipase L1-like esterase